MRFYRFTGPTRENGIPVKLPTLWKRSLTAPRHSIGVFRSRGVPSSSNRTPVPFRNPFAASRHFFHSSSPIMSNAIARVSASDTRR
jgi:hypothetical protein